MKTVIAIVLACFVAVVVSEETACQRARERQLQNRNSVIVNRCDENGNYEALQVYSDGSWKICFTPDGDVIQGPSRTIEYCECFKTRYELSKQNLPSEKLPDCKATGEFVALQSDGVSHWCVDKVTGEKTTEPRPLSRSITCD
uniref:Putative venom protein n=1 Tax=Superstitionia donensis TaxID=311983 RepID=A0A1V1WBF3_9SCOR